MSFQIMLFKTSVGALSFCLWIFSPGILAFQSPEPEKRIADQKRTARMTAGSYLGTGGLATLVVTKNASKKQVATSLEAFVPASHLKTTSNQLHKLIKKTPAVQGPALLVMLLGYGTAATGAVGMLTAKDEVTLAPMPRILVMNEGARAPTIKTVGDAEYQQLLKQAKPK